MNIFQKAIAYLARSVGLTDPRLYEATGGGLSDSGERVTSDGVLTLSTAWACVNLLAGTIGSLPLMVYREGGGGRVVASDHPLYRILHDSPNADQTAVDFWEFIVASLELWGSAYAAVERGSDGRVIALSPIRPDVMTVRRLSNGDIEYSWSDNGRAYRVTQDRMFHVRGFGGSPLGGLSTLAFGRNTFGLALAINKASSAMFANGIQPSGILKFKEWLKPEQREASKEAVSSAFAGAMSAGRPMVLEGGVDWTQLTINPDDAQMLESRAFSVEEVCRMFGVPPHMVGHTEKSSSWGTGLEQQTLGFQKFTLRRRLKRIEQAIAKQLLTPVDRAILTVEFNLEGLLRGDSAARATFYGNGLDKGWLTINEVRRLENLPPVPGGDVPRMQMQNVPITETAQQALPAPEKPQ